HYKFPHLTISGNNRPQGDNTISPVNVNAVGTRAYGAEMELTYLLTPNDRINFNLAYNITRAGTNGNNQPQCFNYGQVVHPQINTANSSLNAACTAKNLAANPSTVNWVRYRDALRPNDRLFQNPIWNGTATYQHVFDLDSGATITARYSVHFESDNQ